MKEVKTLDTKNHLRLMMKIMKLLTKLKVILCSWTERINIVKTSILLQATYRFNNNSNDSFYKIKKKRKTVTNVKEVVACLLL